MSFLLHQFVDEAAHRSPDHEAFCSGGNRMNYGPLAEQTNQLAHLLIDQGVRPGDRVGVHLPRCLESAVAVYGTLKAGAAYVPIDPSIPVGGMEQLVSGCGIRVLISHEMARPALQELAGRDTPLESIVGLGEPVADGVRTIPWTMIQELPKSLPARRIGEQDMAYIMFSSGSTGRPKGIVHTHGSGMSYAVRSMELYEVQPQDRIANHSPLHFDMSTFGYFTGPCAGATTLLIPEAYTKVAASLSQLLENERISIWYSVPLALVQLLLRGVLETRNLQSIRWVLFGGEPFPLKHLRALMRQWPDARFSNVYGPAEVNQCTYYHVPPLGSDPEAEASEQPIPIGQIWDNAEGLVIDDHDNPIAAGETGELVVRTPTMMRGYWQRPDLNERAYYLRPMPSGIADVFYRTGDLVRLQEDGELEFLGRKDRQLKVRGYRIELDDVEHVLARHESVESAAAFPVRGDGADDHIQAAVIPRSGAVVDEEELRRFLSDLLSWYAVPTRIQVLEQFPRTTSGKIDRRRLRAMAEEAGVET